MADKVAAVVGANFGDEGKGLAVDYYCSKSASSLVIRHNGGAQAGHTVELDDKRFVFHQLSSGSFRRADTYLAETFLPDLFKIEDEIKDFFYLSGFAPRIFADLRARVTIIDDVIINMALEKSRGENRHGSCGMGINEAVLRREAGFGISIAELLGMTHEKLFKRLRDIRENYSIPRAEELKLTAYAEYFELLRSETVLHNAVDGILRGLEYLTPADGLSNSAEGRELIVFEGAQGLLLDSENQRFAPHVTASRTGIHNPLMLCRRHGFKLDEVMYVMRSYVTRHGAGHLPFCCETEMIGDIAEDLTNQDNEWQGSIRYGLYPSPEELSRSITEDMAGWNGKASLLVTHLNETGGMVRFSGVDIPVEELASHPAFAGRIDGCLASSSRFSDEIRFCK